MMCPLFTRAVAVMLMFAGAASAQVVRTPTIPIAAQYIDTTAGWSLEDAIAHAITNEPSLRAARSGINIARAMRLQAGLRPNPTLSIDRREEPAGTDNQTMASVQLPLDLFRRSGRIATAEREIDAIQLEVVDRERLVAAEVRAAYGELLAALRELSILDALREAITRQHDLLQARVKEGAAPPLERDLLTVELQRLESERLLQNARLEAALFELKHVVGVPPETDVKVRETLEELLQRQPAVPAGSADVGTVIAQRPDVRVAEARLRVTEAQVDRAASEGRFDVTLVGSYMRMDAGFPQLGFGAGGGLERVRGQFQYFSGGVMVMVPLFNRNQGAVAAARAEGVAATARIEAARVAAGNEIAAARAGVSFAEQAARVFSGGALALARQNLAVVSETFTIGRATVFDVLAEQRRYLELERAYTEALRAAFEARAALRRALGDMQ